MYFKFYIHSWDGAYGGFNMQTADAEDMNYELLLNRWSMEDVMSHQG